MKNLKKEKAELNSRIEQLEADLQHYQDKEKGESSHFLFKLHDRYMIKAVNIKGICKLIYSDIFG